MRVVRRRRFDDGHVQDRRQLEPAIGAEPCFQRQTALGCKVGTGRVFAHDRTQCGGDVRDVGHDRAFGREHGLLRSEDGIDAEFVHEPAFLAGGVVAAAGHCAGMPDRARELALPAPHHACHDWLRVLGVVLVVAARFDVHHGPFGAGVVGQRKRPLRRGEMDVDVLPAGDRRRRTPPGHAQVGRDRRREIAGIGEDGDRAFAQRLGGTVASQRASNAHLVPGVSDTQAVAAEDVDAVLLPQGANLARVVHGELFRDDVNLFELGIHADELSDAVSGSRWREIDHAAIEAMPVIQSFEDVVVDGHVADRCLQHLPAAPRRSTEHDVATRIGVTYGRHVARLAAQDVEHAHAIVAGGNLRERADAHEILEIPNAASVHPDLLLLD